MTARSEPPVSVIIPCYNQARYLSAAIESALTQLGGRPEVIVVDDGSTEDVAGVVAHHPGVRFLNQANQGVAVARNAGLALATRPYLVFLDADDRLLPDALQAGVAALAGRADAAWAAGLCRIIGPDGALRPFRQQAPVSGDPYAALLRSNFVWMPGEAIFRRERVIEAAGFDPTVPASADYDLYLRLARQHPVVVHRQVVAEYRMHDEKMSGNGLLMLRSTLQVLERQWPYARSRREYRVAYAAGNRFWRDFYGDRVVEDIRLSLRQEGRRGRALAWGLALLRHNPRAVAVQLYRKLRNTLRPAPSS
jgi:glycosyltransferase involved in cell wall biosynthesis